MRAFVLAMAACSSTVEPPCTTTLTGNLTETIQSASCATLAGNTLSFDVDQLSLVISIDLGSSPSPDTYTTETVASWKALGSRTTSDGGECIYAAGTTAVPPGSFTLDLTDVVAVHGTLEVIQFVQAEPEVDCGPGDDEIVDIVF